MISNQYYLDPSVFEKEKNFILSSTWLLVGHQSELENKNDFLTINYLGKKIFIQNFGDEIKAFDNVCVHRFATIHLETHGNRLPVCSYHLWTYDKNGKPVGIHNKKKFDEDSINGLALQEYEVALCGAFVFIKPGKANNQTLPEYLGEMYGNIEMISQHFGGKLSDYSIPHQCNWKLLVENVLECYHCKSVHENSFAKMGFGYLPPAEAASFNAHSYCNFPAKEGIANFKIIEKTLRNRTLKFEGYKHFYVFPNTFIASVQGYGFYMACLVPESPETSVIRVKNFNPRFNIPVTDNFSNILDFINENQKTIVDTLLYEDKAVTENIQQNLAACSSMSPVFGDDEFRIKEFYNYYTSKIVIKNDD